LFSHIYKGWLLVALMVDELRNIKAERRIQEMLGSSKLTEEQRAMLRKFDQQNAVNGLTIRSRENQLEVLVRFATYLRDKPFQQINADDVRGFLASLVDQGLSKSYYVLHVTLIRKLLKFLGKQELYDSIKLPKVKRELPEVLTEEEVKQMIEVASDDRDKALIQVLYESGCRLGELVGLRVGDVQFDQYGAKLLVRGKTGDRPVRLIQSAPALQHWLEHHEFKEDPNAPLFYAKRRGEARPLSGVAVWARLKKIVEKAGIKKRVHPHAFRHSRFTHLSRQLTDTELMVLAGWRTRSMCDVYNHLSMRDVEEKLLKIHGVKPEERPEESPLAPKRCPRCQEMNPATNRFCAKCGAVIDLRTAVRLEEARREGDELMNKLLEDPEFQAFLAKKIAELT